MEKKSQEKNRVKTNIEGFDELVQGGLPQGSSVLLTGTPGTGKTIFALQFIHSGTSQKERGLYITFEETAESLRTQANQFGWDFAALEKKDLAKIIEIPADQITETTADDIINTINRDKYTRVVIDSLSALAINIPTTYTTVQNITDISVQRFLYRFVHRLRSATNATKILVSQASVNHVTQDGISEFLCDGMLVINHEQLGGEYSRHLQIKKMRQTSHNEDIHPLQISKDGIVLHSLK